MELCFLDFEHFSALVSAALGTSPMWKLALVAIGALREARERKRVMRAALGSTGLGVAPLRIRHGKFLSRVPGYSVLAAGIRRNGGYRARTLSTLGFHPAA
jgi:hypothetical protein